MMASEPFLGALPPPCISDVIAEGFVWEEDCRRIEVFAASFKTGCWFSEGESP
jgi:hypothetical protein